MRSQKLDTNLDKKSAIFVHIQKTAGTSIVNLARQHYHQKHIISHGDYLEKANHFASNQDFRMDEKIISNLRNVRFLSGHFGHDFAKPFMHERYSFTFLRDPIERVLSFYYFCKNRDANEFEMYRLCQQLPLNEFLKMGLEQSEVSSFIWNNQVWQLACGFGNPENRGLSSFKPKELLDLSVRHLDDYSYIGFAETFENDSDKIFEDLGVVLPKERITSNANPGRPTAKDLPRSTLDLLEQLTSLDQILYEKAWSLRI